MRRLYHEHFYGRRADRAVRRLGCVWLGHRWGRNLFGLSDTVLSVDCRRCFKSDRSDAEFAANLAAASNAVSVTRVEDRAA